MMDKPTDQYAIPRLKKVGRQGLGKSHAARAENGEKPPHTFPEAPAPEVIFNAAPAGTTFRAHVENVYAAIIAKGRVYRPRRDQVLAIEGVLTASPAFFRPDAPEQAGKYTPKSVQILRERGLKFLRDKYGKKLIRAELQLDEVTPHIQFAFFPIDDRGRWSAKNCMSRTALRALWTDWLKALDGLGLTRGIAGAIATHEPIRKYYAAVDRFDAEGIKLAKEIAIAPPELPAPTRRRLLDPVEYITEINRDLRAWGKRETKRILELLDPLIAAAASAELTRRRSRQGRLTIKRQADKIERLEKDLADVRPKLEQREPVPVAAVAEKLGYNRAIDPTAYPGAIEFLEKFEGLDRDQAIDWLNAEFGPAAAAATAAEIVRLKTLSRAPARAAPKLPSVSDIQTSLRAQLIALKADEFRLLGRKRDGKSIKMGEFLTPRKKSKIWSLDDVLATVVGLKKLAAEHEIQIVPVSSQYEYLLVSEMKSPALFQKLGLSPCNILRTGPAQFEAVLRIPTDKDEQEKVRAITKLTTARVGTVHKIDSQTPLKIAGLRAGDVGARAENDAGPILRIELVLADDADFLIRQDTSLGISSKLTP